MPIYNFHMIQDCLFCLISTFKNSVKQNMCYEHVFQMRSILFCIAKPLALILIYIADTM